MHATADFRQERHELDAILASGIFNRAPNLAQLLTYVCAKYFEGTAEQIKEYNIAVEALGRPADFDQKRDSIVRVEAHRLRKRLREYYEADGADHAIRIDIPSGQYAPRFLPSGTPLPSLSAETLVAQGDLGPESLRPCQNGARFAGGDASSEPVVSGRTQPAGRTGDSGDWRAWRRGIAMRNAAIVTVLLLIVGAAAAALWRSPERKAAKVPPARRPSWPRLPTRSRCGFWRVTRTATTPTAWAGFGRATGIFKAGQRV